MCVEGSVSGKRCVPLRVVPVKGHACKECVSVVACVCGWLCR